MRFKEKRQQGGMYSQHEVLLPTRLVPSDRDGGALHILDL